MPPESVTWDVHDDLWRNLTREDFAWIDLMCKGTVALANAMHPSQDN